LEDHWKRRLNGALDVFRSEPYFLEVVPCAIDKANTLGALLEALNLTRDEVIAIGDGVCDVTYDSVSGVGNSYGAFSRLGESVCRLCDSCRMKKTG